MQVEMNAGMDGGNVPLMVQENEQLAQQLTEQPGHAERESQRPPTHPNGRVVETEETQVNEKQQPERERRIGNLDQHLHGGEVLKELLIAPSVGQRQQLREMDQAADQQRDADQQPQLLLLPHHSSRHLPGTV